MFLFISLTHFLCSSPIFLGFLVRDDSGALHWASTVREEAEDDGTPCAGAARPAAGELVRWRRHLKDPACVGGAHTHLAPPPWLWPPPEDADEKLRRMARGDDDAAAAPVGVVPALWWWWCGPWNRPSSPVVST